MKLLRLIQVFLSLRKSGIFYLFIDNFNPFVKPLKKPDNIENNLQIKNWNELTTNYLIKLEENKKFIDLIFQNCLNRNNEYSKLAKKNNKINKVNRSNMLGMKGGTNYING